MTKLLPNQRGGLVAEILNIEVAEFYVSQVSEKRQAIKIARKGIAHAI